VRMLPLGVAWGGGWVRCVPRQLVAWSFSLPGHRWMSSALFPLISPSCCRCCRGYRWCGWCLAAWW
jgi:hypothetical protein